MIILWLIFVGYAFPKTTQASITATLEPVVAIILSGLLSLELLTPTK